MGAKEGKGDNSVSPDNLEKTATLKGKKEGQRK